MPFLGVFAESNLKPKRSNINNFFVCIHFLRVTRAEKSIQERESALSEAKESLEIQVNERVQKERGEIAADEAKKAKLALSNDIEQKTKEVADLQEILKQKDEKLTEAQKVQAELLKQKRELDDAKRELDLTIEKRIAEGLRVTRQQARKEAEDELKFKVSEKEQTIASMSKQIEELKRRAEQGSQQLQGEVQEEVRCRRAALRAVCL